MLREDVCLLGEGWRVPEGPCEHEDRQPKHSGDMRVAYTGFVRGSVAVYNLRLVCRGLERSIIDLLYSVPVGY